jgi:hypothetical protein
MRFTVLLLSMGSVVLYGYALAGLAGFFFGKGRSDYIFFGLFFGTLAASLSLLLWKRYLVILESEIAETEKAKRRYPPHTS